MATAHERQRAGPFAAALYLCAAAGWLAALLAGDLVGVFLAIETAWLASAGLVALSGTRAALNGALRMLAVGGVGAALFLLGVGLLYGGAGELALADLPGAHIGAPALAAAGAAFLFFALSLKACVAPLHHWAGAAYSGADGAALMALGVVGAVGALAVLARVGAHVLTAPALGEGAAFALAALGALSVTFGSVQAVGARTLRRLAAYALAAQAGVIVLTLALGSPAGFAAVLVQLVGAAAAALGLLSGAAAAGPGNLSALDGFGRKAPLAGAALTASAISLMGAPLTLGFLGRWRLVEAGVGAGWWWASAGVIVASLAGVFYGGRLIERLYFRRADAPTAPTPLSTQLALAPAQVAAIALVALGLAPGLLLEAAAAAAQLLAANS